jgi:hypothetical protein
MPRACAAANVQSNAKRVVQKQNATETVAFCLVLLCATDPRGLPARARRPVSPPLQLTGLRPKPELLPKRHQRPKRQRLRPKQQPKPKQQRRSQQQQRPKRQQPNPKRQRRRPKQQRPVPTQRRYR